MKALYSASVSARYSVGLIPVATQKVANRLALSVTLALLGRLETPQPRLLPG